MEPETDLPPTDARGWRRPPTVVVATVAAVVLSLVAVVLFGSGGGDDADLATEPGATTTDDPATTDAPEVLGDRVVRDRADDGSGEGAPKPVDPSSDEAPDPAAPTDPGTTAPGCVQSTDPACGPFRWEPAAVDQPAVLTIRAPEAPVVAGVPASFQLDVDDPDGPVTLACYAVNLDRPGLATGTCVAEAISCPARYGPWPPPEPRPGQASTDVSVRFDEPGTYVVTVDVSRPAGCDQVDPYRSPASGTLTVEVAPPG